MEGASPTEIVVSLAILVAAYPVCLVVSVFVHELGHALTALFVSKQEIRLMLGQGGNRREMRLGRLFLSFAFRGLQFGATSYDRTRESIGVQLAVAFGGPLMSIALAVGGGLLLMDTPLGDWQGLLLLALFVANFRILIVALWPIRYRPSKDSDDVWLSDSLDIWQLLNARK